MGIYQAHGVMLRKEDQIVLQPISVCGDLLEKELTGKTSSPRLSLGAPRLVTLETQARATLISAGRLRPNDESPRAIVLREKRLWKPPSASIPPL